MLQREYRNWLQQAKRVKVFEILSNWSLLQKLSFGNTSWSSGVCEALQGNYDSISCKEFSMSLPDILAQISWPTQSGIIMQKLRASRDEAMKQMADMRAGVSTALESAEANMKQQASAGILPLEALMLCLATGSNNTQIFIELRYCLVDS